jgi:hypothetical protein
VKIDAVDSPLNDTAAIDEVVYDLEIPFSSDSARPANTVTVKTREKVTIETRGKTTRRAMLPIAGSMAVAVSPLRKT